MTTIRNIALAAALIGGALASAPAFADQDRVPEGATASGRWVGADSRTPLASNLATAQQNALEASGATGGAGQHS
ncbi:hypothetical protein [Roseomonas indoligenes]|uniref:DUF4148 domain-containing protein n=1 Tax=Roseomonas indoligenes TaxID=2820811 RepID=A0A940S870_9PROT|nr:hypothetical protein [Pararoseomonas indoligenes]MBP0493797.1 hypothetical protein [Pararoseomonas indoligenes]